VLATAESFGATLATFDRRLADVARERGVAVVGA
jgi:predicted nucleic acid-binding protein